MRRDQKINSFGTDPDRVAELLDPPVVGTQSVFKALSILQAFTLSKPAVSGPEIAKTFGYSIPTTHRLLRALEAADFLVFDPSTHRYSPGPEVIRLSSVIIERDKLARLTTSTVERLRDVTEETAGFHWLMGTQRTCIQEMVSPSPWSIESRVGATYPLTRGAASKAILMGLGQSEQAQVLDDPEIPEPPAGWPAFMNELVDAHALGYTTSFGENEADSASVAVPFVWLNLSVAAFSITGPRERFDPDYVKSLGLVLLDEAERLRRALTRSARSPR